MKKRKKPTALFIVLALFLFAAAGINAFKLGYFQNLGQPQAPALSNPRQTDDSSAAGNVKNNLKDMQAKMAQAHRGPVMHAPGQPLIAVKKPTAPAEPKPNDSSIQGEWYAPESMKDFKKGS